MVKSKEDKFINSVTMQLKLLQTYPLHQGNAQVSKGFRTTFMIILTVKYILHFFQFLIN